MSSGSESFEGVWLLSFCLASCVDLMGPGVDGEGAGVLRMGDKEGIAF